MSHYISTGTTLIIKPNGAYNSGHDVYDIAKGLCPLLRATTYIPGTCLCVRQVCVICTLDVVSEVPIDRNIELAVPECVESSALRPLSPETPRFVGCMRILLKQPFLGCIMFIAYRLSNSYCSTLRLFFFVYVRESVSNFKYCVELNCPCDLHP